MSNATANEELEAAVRLAIHTVVTTPTTTAPTFADVVAGPVATAGPIPTGRVSHRWLALAAAVVLIVAGLAWLAVHDRDTAVPVTDRQGLAGYVLPTELPAGWHLYSVSEHASDPTIPYPGIQVYASGDGTRHAVVEVVPWSSQAAGREHPTGGSVSDAEWNPGAQSSTGLSTLSWPSSAMQADTRMTVVGFDEAQARAFAASLVPADDSSYSPTAAKGYEYEAGQPPTTDAASGELRYSDDHGGDIMVRLTTGVPSTDALLHPDEPVGHLFVSDNPDTQSVSASRVVGDVAVALAASAGVSGTPSSAASITAFMNALAPSTAAAWADQAEALSAQIVDQPVISTVATKYGSIVQRVGPTISGLCLQQGTAGSLVETCVGTRPVDSGSHTDPAPNDELDFLVAGRWFVVYIGSNASPYGSVTATNPNVAKSSVDVAGKVYVVFAPGAELNRFTYTLGADSTQTAHRPIIVG
ncbi:MAG: hypothetical protein JWN39_3821 [Ilumatobacteraceae bacterium]|nr:hypothetical protein [Ilumatobacteraceae bacterium]